MSTNTDPTIARESELLWSGPGETFRAVQVLPEEGGPTIRLDVGAGSYEDGYRVYFDGVCVLHLTLAEAREVAARVQSVVLAAEFSDYNAAYLDEHEVPTVIDEASS